MRSAACLLVVVFLLILSGQTSAQEARRSEANLIPEQQFGTGKFKSHNVVAPLLSTKWGPECFYNASCPSDTASHATCLHVPAGSGAVAMAQFMNFYNFPARGTGEHGYSHPKYGIQYANFGNTLYNWALMPDSLLSLNSDVATLIYHCGVAQDMNFGTLISTSAEANLDSALIRYFGYPKTGVWKHRSAYTPLEWRDLLREELDAGHPVLYSGYNFDGSKLQFFICDGYNGSDSFHINWGFGGRKNGYYSLDNLTPDTINFSYTQGAIFQITPSPPSPVYTMDFENIPDFSLTFNDWSVRDMDQHATYGIESYTFPHQNEPMAFLCFNPALVTPSMAGDAAIQPHGGQRFGACFSSNPPSNNDWFISPQVQLGENCSFSFWIKSYNNTWGLDSYKVAVSTTDNNPASFTVISGTEPLRTTITWTRAVFNLSAYNNQKVYVAIQCVSNDNFLMMIDDLEIKTQGSTGLTADFSADKTSVRVGDPVNFTDQSSGGVTTWSWSFPGGAPNSSVTQNPGNIRYATPGKYDVKLKISNGLLTDSIIKTSYITVTGYPSTMSLDFESLTDFTKQFDPWTVNDVGGGNTYGITGVTFPGNYAPMAYICFNPAMTSPPLTNMTAHSGQRLGCCFSSVPPLNPNNKWLISPRMSLGVDARLELWVQSYNNYFGDEKFVVAVTTAPNTNPSNFLPLLSGAEIAPTIWTKKTYNLSDYNNQDVYIGIQCVTDNGFIFMIDDIYITSTVGIDNHGRNENFAVFPNPASTLVNIKNIGPSSENLTINLLNLTGKAMNCSHFSDGERLHSLDVSNVASGFYLLKIVAGDKSSEYKISIIH